MLKQNFNSHCIGSRGAGQQVTLETHLCCVGQGMGCGSWKGASLKALGYEIHPFLLSKVLASPAGECSSPVLWLEIHPAEAPVRPHLTRGARHQCCVTSPALLNPTVQTCMEGINEPSSACVETKHSSAFQAFQKDLSLEDKPSMEPNILAEKGLGQLLFSLSCGKLG